MSDFRSPNGGDDEHASKRQKLVCSSGRPMSIETLVVSHNPNLPDPYGATSMPIYQSATFQQPGATTFGDYDYTRSGNPTRDALQNQVALLENSPGCKCFSFSTGMSAIATVTRLAAAGDEMIVNDDSYGGTYRLVSKIVTRQGIAVKYVNMATAEGPKRLAAAISSKTRLVMIESPTNPNQRICDIAALAKICHSNDHSVGTLLFIDNTMMSPILCRPLEIGADMVMHSATKFLSGHSDTMAGVVTVLDKTERDGKTLAESMYFYQNAEGTALSPFDSWLVLRGMKTMAVRVDRQQQNAVRIAQWLSACPQVSRVIYAGMKDHPDHGIHMSQCSGGGAVVCFLTGNTALSEHIVTVTKLFKITVSFGNTSSLISIPGKMSHASIPEEVRASREFPEDLVRMSIGIEDPQDLIHDLQAAIDSFGSPDHRDRD